MLLSFNKTFGLLPLREPPHSTAENVPTWTSCRYILAFIGMAAFTFQYVLRINLSVAIVCMVKPVSSWQNVSLNDSFQTENLSEIVLHHGVGPETDVEDPCGSLQNNRRHSETGEFTWSKLTQGYILSSFFYGYIVTQIPGGWLAGRFGGKHVLGLGMLLATIATILIPVAARTHVYLVIILRVIMGLGMGVMFPAMHCLWGKWAPPLERSKLMTKYLSGPILGTVIGMSVSGFLCGIKMDNGWPFIFYIFGGAALLWYVAWNYLVYNSPEVHPRISDAERRYIRSCIGRDEPSHYKEKDPIPWKSIAASPAVWAIILCHVCNNWGSYTILSCTPMYMRDVLKFDIKANGILSALPYICMYMAAMVGGQLADALRSRQILSTVATRKIFQTIAFIVPTTLLVIMGYIDCERRYVAVVLLTLAVTSTSLNRSAYSINHVDIAPRYSGLLFGLSNTAATVPGMIAPTIAAAITPKGLREEWQRVFFITAAVYTLGAILFALLARGEEQPWAKYDREETEKSQESVEMN